MKKLVLFILNIFFCFIFKIIEKKSKIFSLEFVFKFSGEK